MGTPTRMKKYYSTSNVRTAPLEPNRSKPQSPEAKPASGPMKLGIDIPLVLTIACLMAFGLLILYSASVKPSLDYKGTPYYFFLNQLKWAGVGLVTLTIAMYFDYRKINKYVVYILGAAVLALFLVLIIGEEKLGARRAFLNGSVQPSELAKIAIIVYLAFWIKAKESILNKISFGLIPMMLI
ncbi:MAG TPA: FtsW/RodA/SpoVE family cell cycle protein, partial [Anaerolineaceae bacterium]|nr:FtsW/RodA/SpoVE family cell cycle protein [Anaerolineaceae bacterium]